MRKTTSSLDLIDSFANIQRYMNRRSLFGKLIGAVVGIKAAPTQCQVFMGLDPAFAGGDRSVLSIVMPYMTEEGRLKYISDVCGQTASPEIAARFFPKR